ncbi:MAG: DUF362 domain-containing protein [Candidatus Electrothrix sp. AR3]|nr:DUF362 domain-containing protein [Candidatus Electrothrix sp. AR3]
MRAGEQQGKVYTNTFVSWQESLPALLDQAGLIEQIPSDQPILIKPNLVENLKPPITTPVALIRALVEYLQERVSNTILIGEGCGALDYETGYVFQQLGYCNLAQERKIELIDLNEEPCRKSRLEHCRRWPELFLPELCYSSFLLSVPVLKVHTLAGVTLTMKNMMGLVPPAHYRQGNSWKKSAFHTKVHEAVADLNRYRSPDFTLLDATVGMAESHLWGKTCDPPVNRLVAGADPVALDSYGTALLGKSWENIGHISSVNGELGCASPLKIIETS